jgi:hypothetical protein
MANYSKSIKHQLRAYARTAYERELRAELAKLDADFGHWRDGRLSGHELTERLHRFHNGAARELYKRYESNQVDLAVARAIVLGPLSSDEIDPRTLEALGPLLGAFTDLRDNAAHYDPGG